MRLRYKIFLTLLMLYCLHGFVYAQQGRPAGGGQVFTIKGVVFKKSSLEKIPQAVITDMKSQVEMMSDELGGFAIKASVGDTLLITKIGYTPQKIVVTSSYELAINMQPVIQLNEVTIKEQTKKQELNEVMRQYRSQGTFYNGKPPVWSFLNSPLTGFYELFGKTPGNARRFAAYSKNELEYSEIHRRYTIELVKNITKLPDNEVQKFMETFTPSFEDLKEWNDYQLIMYIKKSLAYYQQNKNRPEVNLQKLY
ncbi:MAG: hypothetical protein JWP78_3491 [Mucilaginibacter sp.]|nr:hypothetical protein [Mucilaginibacter sp.]